jgi:hypothetical protein
MHMIRLKWQRTWQYHTRAIHRHQGFRTWMKRASFLQRAVNAWTKPSTPNVKRILLFGEAGST